MPPRRSAVITFASSRSPGVCARQGSPWSARSLSECCCSFLSHTISPTQSSTHTGRLGEQKARSANGALMKFRQRRMSRYKRMSFE